MVGLDGGLRKRPHESDDEDKGASPVHKRSAPEPKAPTQADMSSISKKLMAKMGYKEGQGLGKHAKGIVEPVQLSNQRGRTGLGHETPAGIRTDYNAQWDATTETVSVEETAEWIPQCSDSPITDEDVEQWMNIDQRNVDFENETEFCDAQTLKEMLAAKNVFDELNDRDLRNARTRANPFETVKSGFFQNRAAMKAANIDAVFDNILTDPKDMKTGRSWVPKDHPTDLLYFADVCAGPGGFTEYFLWRRAMSAHGFGFTLKGKDDFRLDNFLAGCAEQFEPHYGVGASEGDGNVMRPDNLGEFQSFVSKSTDNQGVHVFMADGGFSVEGQENLQEILSKRLYLCQFLCALSILREGGVLMCKLFDLFTPFSMGLVYLLYRCFRRVCIHKPNSSRPANSERYIICEGFLECGSVVCEYMRRINDKLDELANIAANTEDVIEVVPIEIIKQDHAFFDYMFKSNNSIAKWQTFYLNKYRTFAQNPGLLDVKQEDVRGKCLEYWKIPDQKRKQVPRPAPALRFQELLQNDESKVEFMKQVKPTQFHIDHVFQVKHNVPGLDFRIIPASDNLNIIFALGRSFIFKWSHQSQWEPCSSSNILLPENTLIAAEITFKYKGSGESQKRTSILRVVDAYFIGGEDISLCPYDERMHRICKMCKAINHEHSRPNMSLVVPATPSPLSQIHHFMQRCGVGKLKGTRILYYDEAVSSDEDKNSTWFIPCKGIYMNRSVSDKWIVCYSKTSKQPYYFNSSTGEKGFHDKWQEYPHIALSFQETWKQRMIWDWSSLHLKADKLKAVLEGEDDSQSLTLPNLCRLVHQDLEANGVGGPVLK